MDYYGKFLPDLSNVLAPLYQLLQKNTKWFWGLCQTKVFESVKRLLTSDKVLVHYDPTKELVLACVASPYGVGAVLLHSDRDGKDRPIAYASRSLLTAERNYAQLEKEGLAIVFGVKKFHGSRSLPTTNPYSTCSRRPPPFHPLHLLASNVGHCY